MRDPNWLPNSFIIDASGNKFDDNGQTSRQFHNQEISFMKMGKL